MEGCHNQFNNPDYLSTHLSRQHRGWKDGGKVKSQVPFVVALNETMNEDVEMEEAGGGDDEEAEEIGEAGGFFQGEFLDETEMDQGNAAYSDKSFHYQTVAKFYLMLESECLVPALSVQRAFQGVEVLSDLSHSAIGQTLINELKGKIPDSDISSLLVKIRYADPVYNAHHKEAPGPGLSSIHLRKQYYKKVFNYEEPKQYNVGPDPTKEDFVLQYVTIERNINSFLQDQSAQKQVDASFVEGPPSPRSYSTILKNYTDGSIFIRRAEKLGKKTFDVFLFLDAFNPTSSCSSVEQDYKTLGVYMTLGNLLPHNRAKLCSLKLVMLVLDYVLKDNREECFSYIINELKKLFENGIMYKGEKIPVVLQMICGDNLGQHYLGGFLENFSTVMYVCRYCEITRDEYLKAPWVTKEMRTPESYQACFEELQDMKSSLIRRGKLDPTKTYSVKGIKNCSEFNEVPEFHVCDPPLACCIGHDGFGGTWERDMAEFIHYFVNTKKWFTYELLNLRLDLFEYSRSDSANKPSTVKKSREKLGGHEVQNWTLIRLFVFLIGDLVKDTTDPVWQLYLKLRVVVEHVCAPQLTMEQILNMKHLIRDYLQSRCSDDLPIELPTTAKTHYTGHFADLYELMGPLCQIWTLRFESKHAFLGRILNLARTHVNITRTMALKDQLYNCYLSTGELFAEGTKKLKPCPLVIDKYPEAEVQNLLQEHLFTNDAVDVKGITIDGQEFKCKEWILLKKDGPTITIAQIKYIISDGFDTFFVLSKHSASLILEYGIYAINEKSCGYELSLHSNLIDLIPQPVYEFNEALCFALKYAMLEASELDNEN